MRGAILQNVRELTSSVLPSLRVVALVYTGLGGFAAMFLVLAAAATPRSPIIEQVTEPAREAVTSLVVQPTSDLVTGLISSAPPAPFLAAPAATPEPFVATISLDVTIADSPAAVESVAVPAAARRVTRYVAPTPVAEEQPTEDDLAPPEIVDTVAPVATAAVVESTPPEMHTASVELPKPLPTPAPTPAPTLTPSQLKAEQNAENDAAIAANKAAQAQAKAAADAANEAAIQANKVAVQEDDKATADAALTLPKAQPTSASRTATATASAARAQTDAGNQAAIDAAKTAKAANKAAAAAVAKATKR